MTALWAWFLGTRVGRYVAGALAIAVIGGAAFLQVLAMGRAQQRATDTAGRLKAISSKRGSDDEVDRMDAGARRRELDEWMRDKPKR